MISVDLSCLPYDIISVEFEKQKMKFALVVNVRVDQNGGGASSKKGARDVGCQKVNC